MTKAIVEMKERCDGKFFFIAFVLGIIFSASFYVYSVNQTVFNTVERQKKESVISSLSSEVTSLEYKYISMKNAVTLDLAYEKGFKNAGELTVISRKSLGRSVATNSAI